MCRSLAIFAITAALFVSLAATGGRAQDAASEQSVEELLSGATAAAERRDHQQAIELLSAAIEKDPKLAEALYLRGRANFCAGKIAESVADFDKYVALQPDAESRQWERGIAYYYAGEFAKGAKQFELYQTYHDQDVENSAWRYLCVARTDGVEKAQANMLPIRDDRRVPMMQIYDLYRGRLKPEDVLAAAQAGNPSKESLNTRLFYAHLYLGLWHEAAGRIAQAKEHLLKAEERKIGHLMWDVAHVHAERLRKAKE
jgi:lipoprotein NlpI